MHPSVSFMSIPFIAALGHDLYINYYLDEEKLRDLKMLKPNIQDFRITDLGWVWNEYLPTSMEVLKDSFATETWVNYIDPILQAPTMIVAIVPFLIALVIAGIIHVVNGDNPLSLLKMKFSKNKSKNFSVYKGEKEKSTKYSRKD